jgi:sec-independent protein translocase protein TatA
MGGLGTTEIIIIAIVILILFGSRKMPDAARSLGKSLRILKTEVKGLHDDDDESAKPPADQPQVQGQLPPGASNTPSPTLSPGSTGTATSPSPGRSDYP